MKIAIDAVAMTAQPLRWRRRVLAAALLCLALSVPASGTAFEPKVVESVVVVLPQWPGYDRGNQARRTVGTVPEGTAVAIRPGGYLVTALHVVDQAVSISVRLPDGREVPARLLAGDSATDLAVLASDADLPVLQDAPEPALGDPVCALGNQFGLGISVTCGVVSALHRSGIGFNPVEDFVQTDAAVNPGASGGALVDSRGRLVGVLSAIFTKGSDADIGVNFATSIALVRRVVDDLLTAGRLRPADAGLRLGDLPATQRAGLAGALVIDVTPRGAAASAGVTVGDVVTAVGERTVRSANDARAALALVRPGARLQIGVVRGTRALRLDLRLPP